MYYSRWCEIAVGPSFSNVYGRGQPPLPPKFSRDGSTGTGWASLAGRPSVKAIAAKLDDENKAVATVMWSGASIDSSEAFNTSYHSDLSIDDESSVRPCLSVASFVAELAVHSNLHFDLVNLLGPIELFASVAAKLHGENKGVPTVKTVKEGCAHRHFC